MATQSYSTAISHSNTTNFRVWGLELSNALEAVGLIKTTDTGQINWASANKPAINASAGYEIRILNDSLHASAPIYVKIEYGTGSVSTYPVLWFTVGTGSNGSGTITDIFFTRAVQYNGNYIALDSTVAAKQTYISMVDGFFGLLFKAENCATLYPVAGFIIHRTQDSSGTPTAEGVVIYSPNVAYNPEHLMFNFSTLYTYFVQNTSLYGGSFGATMPGDLLVVGTINAGVPGDYQLARHYCAMPLIQPLGLIVSASNGDTIVLGTQFTATVLGTSRNYISLGPNAFDQYSTFCMVWE
jgi:hypothetical protein